MASEKAVPEPVLIQSLQASIAPALAMHAGVTLGVFTALGDATLTAADVARVLDADPGRVERLLYALAAVGLLEVRDAGFRNGSEAAAYLVEGRPGYIGGEHPLLDELWRADLLTATSIREARPAANHDFAEADPEASLAFFRRLAPNALEFGRRLAGMIDFQGVRSAIDIGGGPGHSLIGLREVKPGLQVTLLELPETIALARQLLADEPLAGEVEFEAGNIVEAASSTTHDLAILKAVIQVLSREEAAKAIRNTHASLNSGGRILITGVGIMNDDRVSPLEPVLFNLTFMNLYPEGATYTRGEYSHWLSEAGFTDIAFDAMPSGSLLISARKS